MKRKYKNRPKSGKKSHLAVRNGTGAVAPIIDETLKERLVNILARGTTDDRTKYRNTLVATANKAARLKPADIEAAKNKAQEKQQREAEEEGWRLTEGEIAERAREIRKEIQAAKVRFDGATFEVLTDGIPKSLDIERRLRTPYELVNYLRPSMEGHYKRCSDAIPDEVSDSLGSLYWDGMESAFQIGMLAGFIFAGSSEKEIERMEHGLAHARSVQL